MRTSLKATLVAVSMVIGIATVAYAAVRHFTGDFLTGGDFPGDTDIYDVDCKNTPGQLCAVIRDIGIFFDNTFGVTVECDTTGASSTKVAPPGGKAKACVHCPDGSFTISYFCDDTSSFCDDTYSAEWVCKSPVTNETQTQDE